MACSVAPIVLPPALNGTAPVIELGGGWPEAAKALLVLNTTRAVTHAGVDIDAELLDEVALYFGDRHFEHDLVAPAHGDTVDHLGAVADQPRGNIVSLL